MNPNPIINDKQVCLYGLQIEDGYVSPSILINNIAYCYGDLCFRGILTLEISNDNIEFLEIQRHEDICGYFGFEMLQSNTYIRLKYLGESNQLTLFLNTA